jgi:hypothetical protein
MAVSVDSCGFIFAFLQTANRNPIGSTKFTFLVGRFPKNPIFVEARPIAFLNFIQETSLPSLQNWIYNSPYME